MEWVVPLQLQVEFVKVCRDIDAKAVLKVFKDNMPVEEEHGM